MGKIMTNESLGMSRRMKAALVLLLMLAMTMVYSPQKADAASVRVRSTTGSTGAAAATSFNMTALAAAPANGNTMIAVISTRGTTASRVASITQTGVRWSRVTQATNANGTTTEIWSGPVGSGAGTAVTVNLAASVFAAGVVMEYSGLVVGSSADKVAFATGNSTAAVTGTTTATFQANELWIGGIGLVNSGYSIGTPTNSFAVIANVASTSGTAANNAEVYALERMVTATGTASSGGTVTTSSQWSGAIATFREEITTCSTCHGDTASFTDSATRNVAGAFPGSHNGHVVGSAMACSACHRAPATTNEHNHANGFINMTTRIGGNTGNAYGKGRSWAATNNPTAFTTCTNTSCHGTASPAWNANTTNATCTKCHGVSGTTPAQYTADPKTAAPGYVSTAPVGTGRDTGGATVATDPEVGAHGVHLAGSSNYMNPIACTECHANVNTTSSSFTGHMNGTGNLDFGPIASANSTTTSYTAPNCNTYCHFANPNGTYTPAVAVSWTNTALLTGTPSLAGDCSKCHLSPPDTTGNHVGINNINQCNGCHDHVTTSGSFSDKSKHINGVVDGGCNGCHGWPPTTNAHTVHIDNLLTRNSLTGLPGGFVDNVVCGSCHNVSSLTKHAGSVGNDGTSRNIYLPTPSVLQASYQFGVNPVSYDKAGTTTCSNISCHLGSSTAWGNPPTSTCQSCHGMPPVTTLADIDNKHQGTAVNHIGTGTAANTKVKFVDAHTGCQICHGTQESTTTPGTHDPHANYTVSTQHFTGNINMNGPTTAPTTTSTRYDATIRGCLAACHGSVAPYRMTTSGKTITYGEYGAGGDCISCHAAVQPSPIAAGLNAAVTSRVAVTGDFALASRHIRSRTASPAVTNNDCCVCHMEGDAATGSPNATYHKNGYIELRDPDLGTTIKGATWGGTGAGAYGPTGTDARPVRVSRNLGSATIEPDTAAIMINLCLKCHDANGANSPLARVPSGVAGKPFNATVAANPSGNVLDVASQFATTNRSYHPVMGKQNNGYAGGTRMVAPWNGVAKSASTAVWGPLMTCWDCHADTGATGIITSFGVHGSTLNGSNIVALRGLSYSTGTTAATNYCFVCHAGYTNSTAHGAGSAFTTVGQSSMGGINNVCINCHSSRNNTGQPARPIGAADAHGYSTRSTGAAFGAASNGYAFIRSEGFYGNAYQQIVRQVGATTYSQSCSGYNGTGSICSRSSMGTYSPGGVY